MMDGELIPTLKKLPKHPLRFYLPNASSSLSGRFSYWSDLSTQRFEGALILKIYNGNNKNRESDGPGDMLDFYSHYKSGGVYRAAADIETRLKSSHLIRDNLELVSHSSPSRVAANENCLTASAIVNMRLSRSTRSARF